MEHNIRDVKVTMDTENIRAKSVDMLHKELQTSMVAYNLVVQFRRKARWASAASAEFHWRVEHVREFSADSAALQCLGMDDALRSGVDDRLS